MSRSDTIQQQSSSHIAHLINIDIGDGIYLTNHFTDIKIQDIVYKGIGEELNINGLEETAKIRPQSTSIRFFGNTAKSLQYHSYSGVIIKIYVALMSRSNDIFQIFEGEGQNTDIRASDTGITLDINVINPISDYTLYREPLSNVASHNAYFNIQDDLFFEYSTESTDKELCWNPTTSGNDMLLQHTIGVDKIITRIIFDLQQDEIPFISKNENSITIKEARLNVTGHNTFSSAMLDKWQYRYRASGKFTPWFDVDSSKHLASDLTSEPKIFTGIGDISIEGLTAGTNYYIQIRAIFSPGYPITSSIILVRTAGNPPNTRTKELLMVGKKNQALYSLDITDGTAAQRGTFDEEWPSGLTSKDGELMMIAGSGNAKLYKMNRIDGSLSTGMDITGLTHPGGLAYHNGVLYTVDSGVLYSLDENTAEAIEIGPLINQDGITETSPGGLTSHNDNLYLIGQSTDNLYVVDTDTAELNDIDGYSSFDTNPTGLASFNDELYSVGLSTKALYKLGTNGGSQTPVETSTTNFGTVAETKPSGLTSSFTIPSQMFTIGSEDNNLYRLDVASGDVDVDRVGGVTDFGVDEKWPTGLASDGTTIYMSAGSGYARLYTLDRDTGVATRIGNNNDFGAGITHPGGIAWHNGAFYCVANSSLYELDVDTAIAYEIGDFHTYVDQEGVTEKIRVSVNETSPGGLVSFENELYMVGQGSGKLFKLNTDTGEAIEVMSIDINSSGLSVHNGFLYTIGFRDDKLYKLDINSSFDSGTGIALSSAIRAAGLTSIRYE